MQASKPTHTPISRDQYFALSPASVLTAANLARLNALRDAAVKAGKLPAPFVKVEQKEFECLNPDISMSCCSGGMTKG